MIKDALKAVREQKKNIEASFEALDKRKVGLERQLSEINAELVRLQGSFRTADALEKELTAKPKGKEAKK